MSVNNWPELKEALLTTTLTIDNERARRVLAQNAYQESIIFVGQVYLETNVGLLRMPDFGRRALNDLNELLTSLSLKPLDDKCVPNYDDRINNFKILNVENLQSEALPPQKITAFLESEEFGQFKKEFGDYLEGNKEFFIKWAMGMTPEEFDPAVFQTPNPIEPSEEYRFLLLPENFVPFVESQLSSKLQSDFKGMIAEKVAEKLDVQEAFVKVCDVVREVENDKIREFIGLQEAQNGGVSKLSDPEKAAEIVKATLPAQKLAGLRNAFNPIQLQDMCASIASNKKVASEIAALDKSLKSAATAEINLVLGLN